MNIGQQRIVDLISIIEESESYDPLLGDEAFLDSVAATADAMDELDDLFSDWENQRYPEGDWHEDDFRSVEHSLSFI